MTDYGRDTSCTTGLQTGRYATGLRLVAEAVFRRLSTPRGMLQGGLEEENYGLDLTSLIGSAATAADAAGLPSRISAELLKDERIESATVTVTPTHDGPRTIWDVVALCVASEGSFELQLAVTDVSVQLLQITAETEV